MSTEFFNGLLGVSPSQRYWLVQGVASSDESSTKSFSRFSAYKDADVEAIRKLEESFRKGFAGDILPSKGSAKDMKIPDEVIADIVLNQLSIGRKSPKKQNDFLKRFRTEWEGTPALDELKVWGKENRPKVILP